MGTPGRSRQRKHSHFDIPKIDDSDLKHDLEQMGVECHQIPWQNPSPEFVEHLLTAAIRTVLDVQSDEIRPEETQPLDEVGEACVPEGGRHHIQAIGNLRFMRLSKKVSEIIGVDNFSMQDLTKPTAERTFLIACGFVNYARYREKRLEVHLNSFGELEALREDRDIARAEMREAENNLAEIRQKLALCANEMTKRKEANVELQMRLTQKNAETDESQQKLTKEMEMQQQLAIGLDTQENRIKENRNLIEELDEQVVQSPNRLRQSLADITKKVDNEAQKRKDAHSRVSELKSKKETLARVEKRLLKKIRICGILKEKTEANIAVLERLSAMGKEVEAQRRETQKLQEDENNLISRLKGQERSQTKIRENLDAKITAAQEKLMQLSNECKAELEEIAELKQQCSATESEGSMLQKQLEDLDHRQEDVAYRFDRLATRLSLAYEKFQQDTRNTMDRVEGSEERRQSILPGRPSES